MIQIKLVVKLILLINVLVWPTVYTYKCLDGLELPEANMTAVKKMIVAFL